MKKKVDVSLRQIFLRFFSRGDTTKSSHHLLSYSLMKNIDYDDEENWFHSHDDGTDDKDDEEYETSVYLHSGQLQIQNREQLAAKMGEARQRINESGNIQAKSNQVIASIGRLLQADHSEQTPVISDENRQYGWRREHATTCQEGILP